MSAFKTNNKRIAKNTLFLYIRMMIILAVNLYTSRIVLQALGVEDYGTYNIVGGIVSMFTFIGGAMVASTQRYLNYYIGKGDSATLLNVFNASQIIHFIIAIIIIILAETIGVWYIYNVLTISSERLHAAFWAFQYSTFSTAFIIMSYPYNAAIIAREKMSIFAYITLYDGFAKLIIVYIIVNVNFDKLIFYAFLMMMVQISTTTLYRIYCLKNFKECKFKVKGIPKQLFKELLGFSGWNFIGNIANVCLTQGTNLLLNAFFGPAINAARGISVQVQTAVSGFCTNFQNAQNPQIIKSYAALQIEEMHKLIFRSSRFSYYLMLLFTVPIILKSNAIMHIWLGNPPEYSSIFVQYTMFYALIQSLANPLLTGSIATGDVKKIMLIIATFFCMIIPFGYLVLKWTNNPISIFIVQLLMYIIAQGIRIKIVSKQLQFSITRYLKTVIVPIINVSIVSFITAYYLNFLFDDTFFNLCLFSVLCFFIIILIISLIGLEKNEKTKVIQFIKKKINKPCLKD